MNPNIEEAKAYYNRGLAKYALGKYEDAIEDYDISINKNPKYSKALVAKEDALKALAELE